MVRCVSGLTRSAVRVHNSGAIERLCVRGGSPCYELEPRIVQAIKLDSAPQRKPDDGHADLTLKKEFENLFNRLSRLRDGVVDIEVRNSLPFRLVMARRYTEFL
jgi:hypothetical protein